MWLFVPRPNFRKLCSLNFLWLKLLHFENTIFISNLFLLGNIKNEARIRFVSPIPRLQLQLLAFLGVMCLTICYYMLKKYAKVVHYVQCHLKRKNYKIIKNTVSID